jgi:hypothetical protein
MIQNKMKPTVKILFISIHIKGMEWGESSSFGEMVNRRQTIMGEGIVVMPEGVFFFGFGSGRVRYDDIERSQLICRGE